MRKTLLSTLVVALLLGASNTCPAQDGPKPLVTISFSGYEALLADIELIGKMGDNPDLAKMFEAILKAKTQDKGLAGLDPKRPWGVVLLPGSAGSPVDGFGFVPVTDLKELLGVLQAAGLETKDAGSDITEITTPTQPLYIQQKGKWAFICTSPEGLANTVDDPVKLLGGTNEKYDLAIRVLLQNFDPAMKQMIVSQLQIGAEAGLQQMPGENDQQYAIRTRFAKQAIQQTVTMVNELDTIQVGLTIDAKTETAYIDVEVTAEEGTQTAKEFALVKNGKTNFAGFLLPEAALTGNWTGKLAESDITQFRSTIAAIRTKAIAEIDNEQLSKAEAEKAKQLLADLLGVIEKTVEGAQVDMGVAAMLEADSLTLLAGSYVADGAKLETVLKDLLNTAAEENADVAKALKLDAQEHQGVRLHTFTIPIPPGGGREREKAVKLFGENLDAVLGTSKTAVYLALGRDALPKLKAAIDQSKAEAGKEVPPMRISLAATPIARFVAEMADEPPAKMIAAELVEVLQGAGSDDHITITAKPIPNGVSQRLEFEKGIVKVIGAMAKMAPMLMMGGAGGPGGPPGF